VNGEKGWRGRGSLRFTLLLVILEMLWPLIVGFYTIGAFVYQALSSEREHKM